MSISAPAVRLTTGRSDKRGRKLCRGTMLEEPGSNVRRIVSKSRVFPPFKVEEHMRFAKLILKNVLRNKRRTLLTVSSLVVSLFLIVTLATILTEFERGSAESNPSRLMTRHSVSLRSEERRVGKECGARWSESPQERRQGGKC